MESQKSEYIKKLERDLLPNASERKAALDGSRGITKEKRITSIFESAEILKMFQPKEIHDASDWIPSVKNKGESFTKYVEYKPNLITKER